MKKNLCIYLLSLFLIIPAEHVCGQANPSYRLCDFHQHTTFTDGSFSLSQVFAVCDSLGLAWWANSEHGGAAARNGLLSGLDTGVEVKWTREQIKGDKAASGNMWRWQSIKEYATPYILSHRKDYPSRVIIQGLEWNVPGHEHASMSVADNHEAVARFEYQFDENDTDIEGGQSQGWKKSQASGHAKTLEALAWLQENHPQTSWVIPAHPDRKSLWSIADFRDCNTIAPDVCFGFEGIPGHQKSIDRGEYALRNHTYGNHTYGGTGWMCARIGGLWDALLSEGRHWWIFSTSDFHNLRNDFYPGEYNKTYVYMPAAIEAKELASYLRSGNAFVVSGNFVNDLSFHINASAMGETCYTKDKEVTVSIEVSQPSGIKTPLLHHIDLIEGVVGGYKIAGTADYQVDSVSTTRVIKRFDKLKFTNGKTSLSYTFSPVAGHTYYRLRGTHHPPGTAGETDAEGNPLPDNSPNTAEKVWNDQWFYSNPIFVKQAKTALEVVVHRGANRIAPENTLASIQKALEHGATWIEVDVRSSKDGVLYNLHDPSLNRTSNGKGLLKDFNSTEIDKLDAGSWFDPAFAGEQVPRIDEVLDFLKGKAKVYFDVKEADLAQLIRLVRDKGFTEDSFFWFGHLGRQREFIRLAPDLQIKVNASSVAKMKQWMEECKPAIVEVGVRQITPEFRAFCHSHGIKIMATILNHSAPSYHELLASEADMVNLDEPEAFEDWLQNFP
ncbi:MAG: hypothetical protein LBQ65_08795 [Tannerellaceae bacterium]|jgi:glycerophosphoryl diester phosphodiesterase|nr:hypothetical protein [Tannerellaceae bacterium]